MMFIGQRPKAVEADDAIKKSAPRYRKAHRDSELSYSILTAATDTSGCPTT